MDHGRTGPKGALGGSDGGLNTVVVDQGGRTYHPPHLSKDQDITIRPGDRVMVSTPGGGGFGDPLRRAPRLVASDTASGYYSVEQARNMFAVILTDDGAVDGPATESLRSGRARAAAQ